MQRVLIAMLGFCSFLAAADDTVLKLYRPFGDVIDQIAPVATMKLSGQCTTQSKLILRNDAWRCIADGKVFDPCFVKITGKHHEVLCPQSPWSAQSVQLEVNSPLNNQHHSQLDMSRVYPWAIELVNGERCQAIDTDDSYDSMPIRYRCGHQNTLMGYLQRCKPTWSMLEKTADGVRTVELKRAWF